MKNQIEQAGYIKDKFSRYLRSNFAIRSNEYNALYNLRLSELESKLYKGPYLASAMPFKQADTLNELITEGAFCDGFRKIGGVDFDRPCYEHQIKAFDRIVNGNNAVVTTGTGSGKTECFMFPILNELIKECEEGNCEPGVRAIFLFPLNALVYDQIDRLRTLLKDYEKIRFGFYTGRTPEDESSIEGRNQLKRYRQKYGEPAKNEVFTREKMRANPPQILFTNYSMLEYLLIRPTDQSLISSQALRHLRFIVLDEAHIYRGALGIEISLLMRRLKGTANKNIQYVLTSATLGRGREDLPSIIDFAEKLTASKFAPEDVIFGSRQENDIEPVYAINPEDYILLYNNLENREEFINVFNKYIPFDQTQSINTNLYKLLQRDRHTKDLFHYTKNVANYVDVIKNLTGFSEDSISSLVELVTKSTSNDSKYPTKLYDIKYHMFMKAPDGAFISIGDKKDLSLVTVNQIEGDKAFKIGICQNCKVPYVMGITEDDYLRIDDEIDIDESYADKARRLEYYLLEDCLSEEEIEDLENDDHFEKYNVCPKCGFIKSANSAITVSDCEHFATHKKTIYKFVGKEDLGMDEDDVVSNNLHRCPICDYKSTNGGVIMGFHVGKDRATTLVAQILYDSMETPMIKLKNNSNSLFGAKEQSVALRKQYLVFSDSRQQAAFFSKFLNQNNRRFLNKRMMISLLANNDNQSIPYLSVVSKLDDMYRRELHYSDEDSIKYAKAAALWELLLVDGRNSGEGLGLYAYKLNLNRGNLADDALIESALVEYGFTGISGSMFRDLMACVLTDFRTAPSIYYEALAIEDQEEKKELLGYRHFCNYITKQDAKKKKLDPTVFYPVKSFLPVEDNSSKKKAINNTVKFVMKALDYDIDKAKLLLSLIFDTAVAEGILQSNHNSKYPDTYLINASDYSLYSNKMLRFYKCDKCNQLTLYNIKNACVNPDCGGELAECDPDNDPFYKNNYYRNEYQSFSIERKICREHTAQINADEGKEIQEDFKSDTGKINFISCSTTFEMGIDLGGLNTVFMRNVPPTPANYAQRAGRAGRRADTSAFILTFCSTTSHDYSYFSQPEEMIRGLVKPPYFVIDNEKIIIRHITATAWSMYFREPAYSEDYNSIEYFLKEQVAKKFIDYINTKPQKLGEMIDGYLLSTPELKQKYGDYKWIDYIETAESSLNSLDEGMSGLLKLYEEARDCASSKQDFNLAKSYNDAIQRLNSRNSLIPYFTRYNVIPGYGFPVDNVELHIYDYARQDMNEDYNLSRDLSLAISEYAPGSEVIVDDKKYTSRYLFKPKNDYSLPTKYYCSCEKCHSINVNINRDFFVPGCKCKFCDTPLDTSGRNVQNYVTPIYGFVADRKNKNTRRVKPFKTYASDVYYIGDKLNVSEELNNVVEVKELQNGELLVLNESNFYTCSACGYTTIDKYNQLESKTTNHKEYRGKDCLSCGSVLTQIHLGHSYRTDIISVGFNNVPQMLDRDTALSVMFAILEGISITYEIERNDIGGIIYQTNVARPFDLILYDTVSGGAGHVKRMENDDSLLEVLKNALKKVSQDCCDPDASCYNCLRTYSNQRLHPHIKRGLAKETLAYIIDCICDERVHYSLQGPSIDFTDESPDFVLECGLLSNMESCDSYGRLLEELERRNGPAPDGFDYIVKSDSGDLVEHADFAYVNKNILLFSLDNQNSYNALLNAKNRYKCYLLSDSFDYVSFAKEVCENGNNDSY